MSLHPFSYLLEIKEVVQVDQIIRELATELAKVIAAELTKAGFHRLWKERKKAKK